MMKDLCQGVIKSDPKFVAKAMSLVEDRRGPYLDILDELYQKRSSAKVIGITGAPGVGKSALVGAYINELTRKQKKVAVIAVDPSSPFTGGALLGDRIRMHSNSNNVFIRSVASRGALGGVSDAVFNMIVVVRAAGFEYVIVETVGVGQNEISISKISDITLLVMSPGMGDDIQMMKAGIMETGDIFVVNKCDLPGADELEGFLKSSLGHAAERIIKTCSRSSAGVDKLGFLIEELYLRDSQRIRDKARSILKEGLRCLLFGEARARVEKILDGSDLRLDQIVNGSRSPYSEVKRIIKGGFLQ